MNAKQIFLEHAKYSALINEADRIRYEANSDFESVGEYLAVLHLHYQNGPVISFLKGDNSLRADLTIDGDLVVTGYEGLSKVDAYIVKQAFRRLLQQP